MHVLLVTREFPPHVVGGVAYHAYNLAKGLTASGHRVTVLSSTAGDQADTGFDGLPGVDVRRLDCHRRGSPRFWFDRAVQSHLTPVPAWLDDIDLIHSHEYVRFNRTPVTQPVVQKIHFNLERKFDYFSVEQYPAPVRPIVRSALERGIRPLESKLERRALSGADGIVFISELTREIQRQTTGVEQPSTVIHNGVDTERFSPTAGTDDSYFLFVGGRQTRKGHETVREAFAETDRSLRIAGATPPPDADPASNIEYLGFVEQSELPALYANACALVHPAAYEPFGNVVLESLACGTPVIVSGPAHCGAAEILTDEVARIVPPSDSAILTDTVVDFDKTNYTPEACRQLAERYSWTTVAEQTAAFAASISE